MTDAEAIAIYRRIFPQDMDAVMDEYDHLPEIAAEIRAVVEAETVEAAGKVIEWWGCWGTYGYDEKELAKTVRRIRVAAKRRTTK